jgi:hypothetical protein
MREAAAAATRSARRLQTGRVRASSALPTRVRRLVTPDTHTDWLATHTLVRNRRIMASVSASHTLWCTTDHQLAVWPGW